MPMDVPADSSEESTGDYVKLGENKGHPVVQLQVEAITHPGLCRENNEDNYLVARLARSIDVAKTSLTSPSASWHDDDSGHLLIVADGMGGVEGGERASALAVETIVAYLRAGFRSFVHLEQTDEAALFRELKAGIEQADRDVITEAAANSSLAGMGTTVTMAYVVANTCYILHVGDSRAYLFHDGKLTQVTTDHTLVQMLVESRSISLEEARTHPKRNVVTNVVGGPEEGIYVETHTLNLVDGDTLLLCSDGLTEPLSEETMAAILCRESNPAAAIKALLEAALNAGGPDNVTIVLARARFAP
jgi:serine/threonine protein phosphatase PrpC